MKSPQSRAMRVAIFSADDKLRANLAGQFKALASHDMLQNSLEGFLTGRMNVKPQAIVLDVGRGDILEDPRLSAARERWGEIPIIVISDEMSAAHARLLVRLRALDWLQKPLDPKDLVRVLAQVQDDGHGASRVVTFAGASSGAGGSTMALLAAAHIAEGAVPGQTCVVDLDFQQASVGSYVNVFNEYDLSGVVAQPDRLDAELLETLRLERERLAIYSFERPELSFAPTGRDFVLRLLDLAAISHRQVVIDLPRLETPWYADVLAGSDIVFIVFELNVPSLRQARHVLERAREARGSGDNIYPIANKAAFKLIGNPISRKDVGKIFTDGGLYSVARDDATALDALNRGMLPGEIARSSRMVKEANRVFESIFDK